MKENRKKELEEERRLKKEKADLIKSIKKKTGVREEIDAELKKEFPKKISKKRKLTDKEYKTYTNCILLYHYGISLEDFNKMMEEQNYCCAICQKHESEFITRFAVDHCHETNKVRGLLCGNCNKGIGFLKDSEKIVSRALDYLKHYNGKQ